MKLFGPFGDDLLGVTSGRGNGRATIGINDFAGGAIQDNQGRNASHAVFLRQALSLSTFRERQGRPRHVREIVRERTFILIGRNKHDLQLVFGNSLADLIVNFSKNWSETSARRALTSKTAK